MATNDDRRVELVNELQLTKCFCGKRKKSKETFCPSHYFALPKVMRAALYKGILEGYVEAYDEARQWLKEREDAKKKSSDENS